jgi:hypothetical protein
MSFRVKTTHKILEGNNSSTVGDPQPTYSIDSKTNMNYLTNLTQVENKAKAGDATKGLVIRQINRAMSDHM